MRLQDHLSPKFQDKLARVIITAGGVGLILVVAAILIFVVREAAPLAGSPDVSESEGVANSLPHALITGTDEYFQNSFIVHPNGITFYEAKSGEEVETITNPFGAAVIVCASYDSRDGRLIVGSADGRVAYLRIDYDVQFADGQRSVRPRVRVLANVALEMPGEQLTQVVGDRDDDGAIAMAARLTDGSIRYVYVDDEEEVLANAALDSGVEGQYATSLVLSLQAELLGVGTDDGTLLFWGLGDPESPVLDDHVRPAEARLTVLELLLGDQTLVVGSVDGQVSVWLRVRYVRVENSGTASITLDDVEILPGSEHVVRDRDYGASYAHRPELRFITAGRPWTRIHDFESMPGAILHIVPSPREKGFAVLAAGGRVTLFHSTSQRNLAELDTGLQLTSLAYAPRADGLVALDDDGRQHLWHVDNPHPEASLGSLFGKVWYEGYSEPKHVWQSTGGSQEFEPKLGLVPLLVGTLKGTLYAMLFSVPLSILGALYLSQLASPGLRNTVKPLVEMMAAVPTVVVGFLAALWLAPLLEKHLTAFFVGNLMIVPGLAVALLAWMAVPTGIKQRGVPGMELLFLLPFLVLAVWIGVQIAGSIEAAWFDGNLKQWLYSSLGVHYDQRNCIIVGIALGFAVIPIIFSISEDALSSVPPSLTSAALSLGASKWQTALHVVLPAASPGIFAAIMLGLGRAIGETMIVLMATGNTPILDLSIFNGMRTMSAAIAVEIPEAPHGGTLYRVLFLTGALLFAITFLINTLADLISRSLRRRYAQF